MGNETEKEVAVVGIPRCGTTWLFRSIMGIGPGNGTPKGAAYKRLPGLKTHSLAPPDGFGDPQSEDLMKHTLDGGKAIFVFGDPIQAVISTRYKRWDHVHAANCGFFDDLKDANIFEEDCFNYEMMFDSWMKEHDYPVLALRYETMAENRQDVESFLGRKVEWTPWYQRDPQRNLIKVDYNTMFEIAKTYKELHQKIVEAQDSAFF